MRVPKATSFMYNCDACERTICTPNRESSDKMIILIMLVCLIPGMRTNENKIVWSLINFIPILSIERFAENTF